MNFAGALFSLASLAPAPLILAGAWWGGGWAIAAALAMSVVVFALDQLVQVAAGRGRAASEFPAAPVLSVVLGLVHLVLLAGVVLALSGGAAIGPLAWGASLLASGLYLGQISNANAHELIHAPGRGRRALGRLVYISILFGHHASAHLLVHHVAVGTPDDPNSARAGLSYWRFLPRAWRGSFKAGLRAESARLVRRDGRVRLWRHPYSGYLAGAVLALAVACGLGGASGVAVYLGLAIWAQAQLLLSDYVQHYGLKRTVGPDGRAPVCDRLSWNAPHWYSSYMMLNAPRHSDHHAHPSRSFPALRLKPADAVPTLPYSLPAMGLIALWPALWRRVMDPRVAAWMPAAQTPGPSRAPAAPDMADATQ